MHRANPLCCYFRRAFPWLLIWTMKEGSHNRLLEESGAEQTSTIYTVHKDSSFSPFCRQGEGGGMDARHLICSNLAYRWKLQREVERFVPGTSCPKGGSAIVLSHIHLFAFLPHGDLRVMHIISWEDLQLEKLHFWEVFSF